MTRILDCTLRDGSHVKSFSNKCILDTLLCDENAKIDYIEVGYEFPNCIKSSKIKTVVMVDAKNIRPVSKSANCVRVASYPNQIHTAIKAVENFKSQGFEVFLHLMTADKFEDYQLLKNWKNKDILTSIYFADTFGAFMPKDVENIYKKLQNCGFEKISFHAHNNLQLAFANTIKAIELGAYCIDATVFGLGRGGGNLPLEVLLKYLDRDNSEYIELIEKYYLDNPCVYSYKSMISGLNNIHPN
jgi:4-hydroxy 2-oxovalerate aldolase